jgi:hypothetical protein
MSAGQVIAWVVIAAVVVGCIGFDLVETRRFRGFDR